MKYTHMEDFHAGQKFHSKPVTVTAEDIVAFARQFDPQYFHTDPALAKDSVFGGLAASGWHTAALTMRLLLDAVPDIAGGMVGRAVEKLHWPRAVRAGDTLSAEIEVLDVRPSNSNPTRGTGRIRAVTRNQKGEIVQEMETVILLPRRTA
jgi:acyl dehydratase